MKKLDAASSAPFFRTLSGPFPLATRFITLFLVYSATLATSLLAESVHFTETLTDRIVTTAGTGGGSVSTAVTTVGATVTASIVVPGLGAALLNDTVVVTISLGGFRFSDALGNADATTDNSVTFYQYVQNLSTGQPRRVGQISFSRTGNTLTVTGASSDLSVLGSIAAGTIAAHAGPVGGNVTLRVSVGALAAQTTVYYKGSSTVTPRMVGTTEFRLNSVTLAGDADYTNPTVSILKPTAFQRWSNEVFTVQGICTDNVAVDSVLVRLNGQDVGTTKPENGQWSKVVVLIPGTNVIQAVATDLAGHQSSPVTVRMIYVLTSALSLTVDEGGSVTGISTGQILEIGRTYTATVKASNGFLFSGWSGGVTSTNPVLKFPMAANLNLHARFIPNPFIPAAGSYAGLFHPGSGGIGTLSNASPTNSGYFTLMLTSAGTASGKLLLNGSTLPFNNLRFGLNGAAHQVLVRPGPDLTIDWQLDFGGGTGRITGTAGDGSFTSGLLGHLGIGNATFAGRYNFVLPGGPADSATVPAGDGAGSVIVDARGLTTVAATLGDGTGFSQGSLVSRSGDWPVFTTLQGGRGVLFGWATFTTNPQPYAVTADHLTWLKAPTTAMGDNFYRDGFKRDLALLGARYVAPAPGLNVVGWSNGIVLIDGGNLTVTLSNQVAIANNRVTVLSNSNRVSLTIAPPTGLVTGTFKHPAIGPVVSLKGVVVQLPPGSGGAFVGSWFRGTNKTGFLQLKSQ